MQFYIRAFQNYTNFSGRDTRQQFWMFALISFLISIVLGAIDGSGTLSMIYGLAVLVPGLAIGARRLHDIGMSGWLQVIGLIPLLGAIILIVLFCFDSKPGNNQYGPNPKGATAGTVEPMADEPPMHETQE